MGRAKDSLKHQLRVAALDNITDNDSRKAYRRACDAFSAWAKVNDCKQLSDVSQGVIQRYETYLEGRPEGYTAATIHAKLAPVCKAAGVNMRDIRKPKRTSGKIVRGRKETKTGRGEKEATQAKYARLVTLQKCVGIRRAELAKLEGRDLIEDKHGQLYIKVRQGKGGKNQLQYILPKDRETVRRIFADVGQLQRVFSDDEMKNCINLHKMRAEHAKDCYAYYERVLREHPEKCEELRTVLVNRWKDGHKTLLTNDERGYFALYRRFVRDTDDRPFILRGENKRKAEARQLPVKYNRLALMAVSVLHLSHWRLDVTSVNYLVQ